MSQENVELARSLYEAVQRGDYERPFEVLDTNIIWDVRLHLPTADTKAEALEAACLSE